MEPKTNNVNENIDNLNNTDPFAEDSFVGTGFTGPRHTIEPLPFGVEVKCHGDDDNGVGLLDLSGQIFEEKE